MLYHFFFYINALYLTKIIVSSCNTDLIKVIGIGFGSGIVLSVAVFLLLNLLKKKR